MPMLPPDISDALRDQLARGDAKVLSDSIGVERTRLYDVLRNGRAARSTIAKLEKLIPEPPKTQTN